VEFTVNVGGRLNYALTAIVLAGVALAAMSVPAPIIREIIADICGNNYPALVSIP
jgi:hypothetical protein